MEENQGHEGEEQAKNNLMEFVLQLESVSDEEYKSEIQRLWEQEHRCYI